MWVSAKETRGFIPLRTLARDLLSLECHPHKAGFDSWWIVVHANGIGMMDDDGDIQSYQVLPSIFRCFCALRVRKHLKACYFEFSRNPAPGIYESLYVVGLATLELVQNFLPSTVWCVWMCLIPSSQVVTVTSLQSVGSPRRFSKELVYLGILNASLRPTWKCNAIPIKDTPQTMRNCTQLGFFTQRSWGPALFWIFPTCTSKFSETVAIS